ncbi:MAG: aldose epimerase family protein, partial [bacterium]
DADQYTTVDENLIPIGPHEGVEDTPFDFREPKKVGDRIEEKHPQLIRANGYDQNYVLNQVSNPQVSVTDPVSGRVLEISTTMPGVQFYTG